MNTLQAIHEAILEEPEEIVHRLAYADVLTDLGHEAQAGWIRRSIKLNRPLNQPVGCWEPWTNSHQILPGLPDKDFGSPPGRYWIWSRGFILGAACSANQWQEYGSRLVREHPISYVYLTDYRPTHLAVRDRWFWQNVYSPPWLRRLIREIPQLNSGVFQSADTARKAMSEALIAWARSTTTQDK